MNPSFTFLRVLRTSPRSSLLGATTLAAFVAGSAFAATGCSKAVAPADEYEDEYEDEDASGGGRIADGGAVASDAPIGTDVPLQLFPTSTYTGIDDTHTFQVPVVVYGSKTALVRASDPSAVDVKAATRTTSNPGTGSYFLVTVKRAGEFTLTAYEPSGGSSTATARLVVTQYSNDRFGVGEQRYKNDASSGPACSSCHGPGKVDHSPAAIAPLTDDEVVTVMTAGVLKDGKSIEDVDHRWAVSEPEANGLVTYLRALPPNGYTAR